MEVTLLKSSFWNCLSSSWLNALTSRVESALRCSLKDFLIWLFCIVIRVDVGLQGLNSNKLIKKDGFGNHSEATINLNLKLNYENSYLTLSTYSPVRVSILILSP